MSRTYVTCCLVSVILLLTCLSGCQQQYQKEKTFRSYKFVDTASTKVEVEVSKIEDLPVAAPVEVSSVKAKSVKVDERTDRIKQVLSEKRIEYMTITGYCPCAKCCGWKLNRYGNPVYNYGSGRGKRKRVGYTSTGTKAEVGTIAADVRSVPYGTRIYVPGYGFGEVKDTGGALKGNHIDLYFNSHREAVKWGVKYLKVAVWSPETKRLVSKR